MATLYDHFGREIQVQKKPEMREIAAAVIRDRWSSYPSEGLTPQRLATIFKEANSGDVYRQAELFEEMEEKDTHLFSELQTRKNAVAGLEHDVLPATDSAEDKKICDFCKKAIDNIESLDENLLDLLDAISKGYSMLEILWSMDGQQAIVSSLQFVHPKRAVFYNRTGALGWDKAYEMPRITTEAQPWQGEEMPPFKLVYHRYKARSGYDTRAGILRVCAWMYLFKNYALKDWVAFAEVFGMPLRLGKYDATATPEDKAALIAAITSIGSDAAGVISKSTEIEFVESTKNVTGTKTMYQSLCEFCNREMSKAILGQTGTTEGTPGRLGNDEAQDNVRQDLIEADAKALCKTIRSQIIRPLVGYNFGWDKNLPKFALLYEDPEDLKYVAEVYKGLYEMRYPLTVEHISQRFKVPIPQKGETLLEQQQGFQPLKRIAAKDSGSEQTGSTSSSGFTAEQEAIESLADGMLEKGPDVFAGITEPVKKIIQEASSFEELREKLLSAYAEMETGEFDELLQRSIFAADMWGRYSARGGK